MNLIQFTKIISDPASISKEQTRGLDEILEAYPFFQAAHFLRLYALKKQRSFRYNDALKKTAAYTTDRELLFNYITSFDFEALQAASSNLLEPEASHMSESVSKDLGGPTPALSEEQRDASLEEMDVHASEKDTTGKDEIRVESEDEIRFETTESLIQGKPLDFKRDDTYSFGEWLKLTQLKPIDRTGETPPADRERRSNMDLINAFIAKSPRITVSDSDSYADVPEDSSIENEQLMTETLAHVYVEQKKYEKAIAAFTVLSLKYPEKSSFFADRIEAVRKLQNN